MSPVIADDHTIESSRMTAPLRIRRAGLGDARAVAAVMNAVIAEGGLTVFDRPFSDDEERAFIAALGPRSLLNVADVDEQIVGVQSLDLFSPVADSLAHVATMGTWLRADARGRGIGRALAAASCRAAEALGYKKVVVTVLATNARALRFYRGLGFTDIGVARQHVSIGGQFFDEVLLETLIQAPRA
jgi:RimJ/RimL family protein N-acetyltransferase